VYHQLIVTSFIEHKCLSTATELAQEMVNKLSAQVSNFQLKHSCTEHGLSLLCLASVLRCLIHTYVSLTRPRQELLGRRICLSFRGKESVSAFLNIKPLWLKKHTARYTCIYNFHGNYFDSAGAVGGTWLSQAGLGGEYMITDPEDMVTIISPIIVD